MRISIIAWLASSAILTGGAMLAALAQDLSERPRDRCTTTFSIEPRDFNKGTGLPAQPTDDLI
jgi:hypothetical protein